jgi:hypothetical protein
LRVRIKNNRLGTWLATVLLMLAPALAPHPAYAYDFKQPDTLSNITGRVCPISKTSDEQAYQDNLKQYGLTKRIIICVKETILYVVAKPDPAGNPGFLIALSDLMATTVSVMITLAIVLWGMLMATGKTTAPVRDLSVLLMKIGAVLMFSWNFNGWFPLMLDAMEHLLGIVSSYALQNPALNCSNMTTDPWLPMSVWERIDCTLQTLIGGILPYDLATGQMIGANTVRYGIAAFLVVSLFSGAVGIFIALLGFWLILQFLLTVARAVYIFICSYLAFSLMVLISPFFVPLILFRVTKAYFEKWLKITMGFILQPIFLFAYLAMLLAVFDTVVFTGPRSLYRAIAGQHVSEPGFKLGEKLRTEGVYAEDNQSGFGVRTDFNPLQSSLPTIRPVDSGVAGIISEEMASQQNWEDIFSFLKGRKVFRVDAPTTVINWEMLAAYHGGYWIPPPPNQPGPPALNMKAFFVNLFLSFILALVTGVIFFILLDALPFIGSGITAEPFSSQLGMGKVGSVGKKALGNIQGRIAQRFSGGGG